MNVNDVVLEPRPEGCWLEAIFQRQNDLKVKYDQIEKANGLLQTEDCPINLHDRFGQQRIKDFCWRITEEIAEAMEVLVDGGTIRDIHHREELIDALHFLVELCLMVEVTPENLTPKLIMTKPGDRLDYLLTTSNCDDTSHAHTYHAFGPIYYLGMACNCLKNKPWKNTHQITDTKKFKECIVEAFGMFFSLLADHDFTAGEVYDLYFQKSKVNAFRQESNY